MKTNQDYKNAALAALKGKWTPSVVATLVLVAIMSVVMILAIIADVSANPDSDLMSPGAFLVMYGFLFLIYLCQWWVITMRTRAFSETVMTR